MAGSDARVRAFYGAMFTGPLFSRFLHVLFLANFVAMFVLVMTVETWAPPAPDAVHSYRLPITNRAHFHYGRPLVGRYMMWGGLSTIALGFGLIMYKGWPRRSEGKPHTKGKLDNLDD